ncbi:MAG: nucleoside monophosphate kinase [Candidatus Thiodiazotropha sp.]
MRIVILGGPGSGKKTQTGLLAEKYGLTVVAAGELVKQALAEESERGEQLRLQQQAGHSVTDDVVLTLLQERLQQPDLENGFILDGYPRNLLQALTLDELLVELATPLDFVLLFEIETDALMERLVGRRTCRSCGAVYNIYTQPTAVDDVCDLCGGRLHQRADDTEETVSSRLHVFDHLTGPLLSHYGKMGKVLRVDGEGEVESVFGRTCEAVESYLAQRPDQAVVAEAPASYDPQRAEASTVSAKSSAGSAKKTPSEKGKPAEAATESHPVPKKASSAKAASGKSSSKKSPVKRAAAKSVAPTSTSKAVASKQQSSVKKKLAKKSASKKKVAVKKIAAKKAVVKKAQAKKTGKKVVKKVAAKRAAAGKSPVSQRASAKKAVKKQVAKKALAKPSTSAKAKASVSKKRVAKKPAAKKAVKKKPVIKQPAPKTGSKKKLTAKPSSAKKSVKKPAANKRAKGSSARR